VRVGVLGGTFDPIHLGHLLVAEQAREALTLDRVLLIPAARPPHKPETPMSAYGERLEMVRLALEGAPELEACELERDRSRPSFTVDTLARLRAQLGSTAELWLLLGSDSLRELPTWREPERIAELARLAVYPRPGEAELPAAPGASLGIRLSERSQLSARRLDGPRLLLSSTEIRERARAGRSIRFLVPAAVERFIRERGVYAPAAGGRG
jgi:nicotinate-nucleotide adenylyltransferase